MAYQIKNPIRVVTAAALFDGHDAAINVIRRILQDFGAEVIHLGHNRSVFDVVSAVLQEGAQGVCISSYQGGHMEYFKYLRDLLDAAGAHYVKIYGGGGGVIIHEEKRELEEYGISQIFHPDDGRRLGLEGMIECIVKGCDFDLLEASKGSKSPRNPDLKSLQSDLKILTEPLLQRELGVEITGVETRGLSVAASPKKAPLVLGVTGTGGAGKSSLVDELLLRFKNIFPEIKVGVVCVDPSKKKTGGALLGDRIRMNTLARPGLFMRSLASRGSGTEISESLPLVLDHMKSKGFDLLIAESSGIGQASSKIIEMSDLSL